MKNISKAQIQRYALNNKYRRIDSRNRYKKSNIQNDIINKRNINSKIIYDFPINNKNYSDIPESLYERNINNLDIGHYF